MLCNPQGTVTSNEREFSWVSLSQLRHLGLLLLFSVSDYGTVKTTVDETYSYQSVSTPHRIIDNELNIYDTVGIE